MFKAIMFAMLLFTGASFAHENPSSDSSPCAQLDSQDLCQNYATGQCAWDAANQQCNKAMQISHHDHHHRCRHMGYYECLRSHHCYWSYGRCHRN